MNTRTLYIAVIAITSLLSCEQNKDEVNQSNDTQPQPQKVQQVFEVPVEMIKSPEGEVYFPENIHRPKTDRDSVVWVKPSDLK